MQLSDNSRFVDRLYDVSDKAGRYSVQAPRNLPLAWRLRSKAESVSPYGGAVAVPGGYLGLGCYLEWSHQTELIDRHRVIFRVVLPGSWP